LATQLAIDSSQSDPKIYINREPKDTGKIKFQALNIISRLKKKYLMESTCPK